MKMPIKWHQECLKNQKDNHERKINELKSCIETLERETNIGKEEIKLYSKQVETAIKKNKMEFDNERYCIKRGKK